MQQKHVPNVARRPRCTSPASMPPVELGLIMRLGGVPVVLGSLRDPHVVRGAMEAAMRSAPEARGDIGRRQEMRLFGELLRQFTGA